MRWLHRCTIPFVLLLLVVPVQAQQSEYGSTQFENSGAEAAQEPFLRGLLMLHSFEYGDARAAFQKAQEIDPDFAMAHWGEAMTHNHPIWMEQDREAALKALQDLAPSPTKQLAKAPTEREKAYLQTLHVLYGVGNENPKEKEPRDDAYEEAMADLAERYPEDLDAQAFHALSILGTAHEGRDFSTYMRAAAIVEEVFDENPQHPGAAHYLIHAYDDPVHAPLGLRPARVYADIAPAASHALHMPSHIFFAMGMWDRGASSNVDSYEAAKASAEERGEALDGGGYHALHWLHYARLQQGRYDDARSIFKITRRHATAPSASSGYSEYMKWYMPIAYVVETQRWDRFESLVEKMNVDVSSLERRGSVNLHAGRGLVAAKRGNLSAAQSALEKAKAALGDSDAKQFRIPVRELEGLVTLKAGKSERALERLKEAARLEEEMPLEYGPPLPIKPAHELYGEVLLSLERPTDALSQFEETLSRYPGRALSLWGKAKAAVAAGQPAVAKEATMGLQSQWTDADDSVRRRLEALPGGTRTSTTDSK